jgi:nucleotide-binding universal stress UspA family protein
MKALRSILVPLDGSPFAEQALPLACDLVRRAGATLRLAMVHQVMPMYAASPEAPQLDPALEEEWRRREQTYLDDVVARLKKEANLDACAALLTGYVPGALEDYVEATATDLVIMTTHGRGPLSRFWLGSVADKLMRTLPIPILMIRPSEKPAPTPISLERILIPLDRSTFSEAVLGPAIALGKVIQARFTLLHVFNPVPMVDPSFGLPVGVDVELNEETRRQSEAYLDGVADRFRKEGFEVECLVGATKGPAQGVLDQLAGGNYDLVALATHGASGVRRAIVGSVADKVVRAASCPVLVLPPGA